MGSFENTKYTASEPTRVSRSNHCISRANISEYALKVLYRLKDAGYAAYLVGGGVRDLLLGLEPKDFDIATDAKPEQVRELFRNCRLIGRRFRLAHVYYGQYIIEVATFRAGADIDSQHDQDSLIADGRIIRDNVYGTIEEYALRRVFTINSMYYDIRDFSVLYYADAMRDLTSCSLRLIGDPEIRYREDPVRMLRAVRFAAKLGFHLESATGESIPRLAYLLNDISTARLFDEVVKLFHSGFALKTFGLLRQYGLFQHLFPETEKSLQGQHGGLAEALIVRALENTDKRIAENLPVTPAFLFAVFLWRQTLDQARILEEQGMHELSAIQQASGNVISRQVRHTALPKRFSLPMREIWLLQSRLQKSRGKRALRVLGHPRFRAAYDFFCMRAQAGEDLGDGCEWWTKIQEVPPTEQLQMAETVKIARRRPARRRRKKVNASE